MIDSKAHYVVATAIIHHKGRFLIAKRASWEKVWPNRWTVPGGKLVASDYKNKPYTHGTIWYGVIGDLVRREVLEEVGLTLGSLCYLTDLCYLRPDGVPTIVISMVGEYASGEVRLCDALTEHAWVTLEQAKEYDLIEGLWEELEMVQHDLCSAIIDAKL
ncbi:NUDIX domain-containing protein [Candidatus Woesearchaeota archaeon]|nr:NUDIX domain-containing protein [Candidatus Woesearchaeota archaeon]